MAQFIRFSSSLFAPALVASLALGQTTESAVPPAATPPVKAVDLKNAEIERPGDAAMLLKELHVANLAEMQEGKLAEEQGADPNVRKYGSMLVKDHAAADKLVMQCAQKEGVTLSDELPAEVQAGIDDLRANRFNFDRAFVAAEAKGHAKVVADLEAARKLDNKNTTQLIDKLLPKVRAHEKEAKKLDQKLAKNP